MCRRLNTRATLEDLLGIRRAQQAQPDELRTMAASLDLKQLENLDDEQRRALRRLAVSDEQLDFGGSFEQSIDECLAGPRQSIRGLGVMLGRAPIGFVVLKRPPLSPDWADETMVTLHGLKIDIRRQGKGFGRAAFVGALAMCREIWPEARQLALSVDAGNQVALSLYKSFGMTDSGPVFRGRIGPEHRLQITLD